MEVLSHLDCRQPLWVDEGCGDREFSCFGSPSLQIEFRIFVGPCGLGIVTVTAPKFERALGKYCRADKLCFGYVGLSTEIAELDNANATLHGARVNIRSHVQGYETTFRLPKVVGSASSGKGRPRAP